VVDADTYFVVGQDGLNGTVFYSCDNDYRLISDDNKRQCVDGVWTGSIPMCG
jgi:Sushi repeat (SCR repeat)